jgi:hypothetical protein
VFEDSNLIVQQIRGDSQYLDGVINSYRNKCLDIIAIRLQNFQGTDNNLVPYFASIAE